MNIATNPLMQLAVDPLREALLSFGTVGMRALSTGAGPLKVFVSLGYSAWGEGQLESELLDNSWLTVAADLSVIFDTPVEQRYDKALKLLGLESWMLSPVAGHA